MVESPTFWSFIVANFGVVVGGSLLAGLSYLAYQRSNGQRSYRFATISFGLIVLAGCTDLIYLAGFAVNYYMGVTELLFLSIGEDILFAAGLGLLFYAITQYDSSTASTADDHHTSIDTEESSSYSWIDD